MRKSLDTRKNIATRLRMKRAEVHLSQRIIAEAIGVRQSTLCSWENTGAVSADKLWLLADFYDCSIDELVGRTCSPERECYVLKDPDSEAPAIKEVQRQVLNPDKDQKINQ